MNEPADSPLRTYLHPVVLIAVLILLSVFVLIGAAIMGLDRGVLAGMSRVDFARGLITYLFAVATIGTAVVLVVSALLGTEDDRHERRFQRGKEILALLLGVFGTIVGFYFGSEVSSKGRPEETLRVLPLRLSASAVAPGANFTVTTFVSGGAPPYRYGAAIGGSSVDRTQRADESGWIVKELIAPSTPAEQLLPVRIEVQDAKGDVARQAVGITVKPSP